MIAHGFLVNVHLPKRCNRLLGQRNKIVSHYYCCWMISISNSSGVTCDLRVKQQLFVRLILVPTHGVCPLKMPTCNYGFIVSENRPKIRSYPRKGPKSKNLRGPYWDRSGRVTVFGCRSSPMFSVSCYLYFCFVERIAVYHEECTLLFFLGSLDLHSKSYVATRSCPFYKMFLSYLLYNPTTFTTYMAIYICLRIVIAF